MILAVDFVKSDHTGLECKAKRLQHRALQSKFNAKCLCTHETYCSMRRLKNQCVEL